MDDIDIKKFMAEKLNEGVSLSDIQKEIQEKFNRRMSYMDVRVMASTLDNIDWSKNDPVEEPAKDIAEDEAKKPQPAPGDGNTVVEVSKLVRPGAAMSGTVKFASGAQADWILDQRGGLGFDNVVGEPTEADTKAFIAELQRKLQSGR